MLHDGSSSTIVHATADTGYEDLFRMISGINPRTWRDVYEIWSNSILSYVLLLDMALGLMSLESEASGLRRKMNGFMDKYFPKGKTD